MEIGYYIESALVTITGRKGLGQRRGRQDTMKGGGLMTKHYSIWCIHCGSDQLWVFQAPSIHWTGDIQSNLKEVKAIDNPDRQVWNIQSGALFSGVGWPCLLFKTLDSPLESIHPKPNE